MTEPSEQAARLRGGGTGIDAPKPPDARKKDPKSKKKDLKEVKESWGKVDELDDRQKHDMAILGKQTDALRNAREPKKKRRSERESLDPSIREILEKYCEFSAEQGHSNVSLQMQQALKELARQLQATAERAESAEETLSSLQAQLEEQSSANKQLDKERLSALQKVEELQLQALELQSQVECREKERRQEEGAREERGKASEKAAAQVARLEALLKEAILRGAKLSRAAAEAEAAQNETERQKQSLEKTLERERRKTRAGSTAATAPGDRAARLRAALLSGRREAFGVPPGGPPKAQRKWSRHTCSTWPSPARVWQPRWTNRRRGPGVCCYRDSENL